MKVEDFWNQAFLMSLARVAPPEAKANADLATELCIQHWQQRRTHWGHPSVMRWKDMDIVEMPKPLPPDGVSEVDSENAS